MGSLSIGYLIGALGRGGSERQLTQLAVGMAERGHRVEIVCYDGAGALDAVAEERGISVRRLPGGSRLAKLSAVRDWVMPEPARNSPRLHEAGVEPRRAREPPVAQVQGRGQRPVDCDLLAPQANPVGVIGGVWPCRRGGDTDRDEPEQHLPSRPVAAQKDGCRPQRRRHRPLQAHRDGPRGRVRSGSCASGRCTG